VPRCSRARAPRGHLIEQRLEEVEVPSVDERDIDRHATQAPRKLNPAKPPPMITTRCGCTMLQPRTLWECTNAKWTLLK